jgi:hypothetical protein
MVVMDIPDGLFVNVWCARTVNVCVCVYMCEQTLSRHHWTRPTRPVTVQRRHVLAPIVCPREEVWCGLCMVLWRWRGSIYTGVMNLCESEGRIFLTYTVCQKYSSFALTTKTVCCVALKICGTRVVYMYALIVFYGVQIVLVIFCTLPSRPRGD